jgi:hypothetical protein
MKAKLLAGIAVVAVMAGSAAGGWFARMQYDAYLDRWDSSDMDKAAEASRNFTGPGPETGPSFVQDGSDTRPTEDLPKCEKLDPKYLAWLDSVHVMRPRCQ